MSKFYVTTRLGENRSLTPEGFLVCTGVPVARTGEMLYLPDELTGPDGSHPVPANDGKIHLWRYDADLFRPETMASAEGKPVVLSDGHHADMDINPDNWNYLAVGTMQNVRQGTGAQADLMLADLIITGKRGIEAVNEGKDEVSIKYDYRLDMDGDGIGRQSHIIINHVAIVDIARGGPILRIGDESTTTGGPTMAALPFWARAMRHALKAGDEETAAEIAKDRDKEDEDGEEDGIGKRFRAIEDGIKSIADCNAAMTARLDALGKITPAGDGAEEEDEDEDEEIAKMKSGDSGRALLKQEWQETASKAEILAPGLPVRLPAFESVKTTRSAADSLGRVRKAAIGHSTGTAGEAVRVLLKGRDIETLDTGEIAMVFDCAAEIRRNENNRRQTAGDGLDVSRFIPPTQQSIYRKLYASN